MTESVHDWDGSYRQPDPAPWDIGRPQPAIADLAAQGRLDGDVLDVGCGTGEHALLLAARGARATGVDLSETAISRARQKAAERGLTASFAVGDILTAQLPQHGFDVIVDSGLFHSFRGDDRGRYVAVLSGLLRGGGLYCLMCFSDRQPGDWGPLRVRRGEIELAFRDGWTVESIEASEFNVNPGFDVSTAQAWLALIRRSERSPCPRTPSPLRTPASPAGQTRCPGGAAARSRSWLAPE